MVLEICVVLLSVLAKKEYFVKKNAHILCIFCVNNVNNVCIWKCKWRQQTTTWANHCWNVVTHTSASQDNQMYPRHKILWCVKQGNTFKLMTMSSTTMAGQLYSNNSYQLYSSIMAPHQGNTALEIKNIKSTATALSTNNCMFWMQGRQQQCKSLVTIRLWFPFQIPGRCP